MGDWVLPLEEFRHAGHGEGNVTVLGGIDQAFVDESPAGDAEGFLRAVEGVGDLTG